MKLRPINGHNCQGAEAFENGVKSCPWKQDTLAFLEWNIGYTEIQINENNSNNQNSELLNTSHQLCLKKKELFTQANELLPTVYACEVASQLPTFRWSENMKKFCDRVIKDTIMVQLTDSFGEVSTVTGAYWGPVSKTSIYKGASPIKTSWCEFESGLVLDPFKWIMENKTPILWVGNQDQYDALGSRLRLKLQMSDTTKKPTLQY